MSQREIKTEEDFEALMREIDEALQAKGIPIQWRQLGALGEASRLLGVPIRGNPSDTEPIPGVYSGYSLSAHINEWTQRKYGDRLKVDYSIGRSVYILQGDVWLIRFPLVIGTFVPLQVFDLSVDIKQIKVELGNGEELPTINVLKYIENLPQGMATELTEEELSTVSTFIIDTHYFFDRLDQLGKTDELARSARSDYVTAAQHCAVGPTQYGLARWAALQACEKMLKCFIASKNLTFPYTHNLSQLVNHAYPLGLPKFDENLLTVIQCDASVRYGNYTGSLAEVVEAIHAAVDVGRSILNAMQLRDVRCLLVIPSNKERNP